MSFFRWFLLLAGFTAVLWNGGFIAAAEEEEDTEAQDEIVVTATRIPIEVSDAPGTVDVITREEIQQTAAKDMAELLSMYLGVQLNTTGLPGGASSVGLRGAGSEQVLVMINGIPMVNPQNGVASLSFLSADMVERIEVIQGPLSSLYGEDALGGVINIITGGKPGTKVNIGFATWDTADGSLAHYTEKTGLGVGVTKTDGHRENSQYQGNWEYGFFRPEVAGWKLDFGFYHYEDDKGLPGMTTWPSLTAQGEDAQTMLYLIANRKHRLGDMTFRIYNLDVDSEFRDIGVDEDHEAYRRGLELQSTWEFKPNLSLVAVGKWEATGADSTTLGEKSGTSSSLAAQLCWKLTEKLQIYAGDLFYNPSLYDAGHSPRISLVYQVKPGFVLKAMGSEAYRAPTFNELYWPADPWSHGNPDLKPESGRTWEIGAEYQWLDRWVGKIAIYDTRVKNLIEWLPEDDGDGDPLNDPWTPQNHGKVRLRGIDTSLAWKITSRLKLATHLNLLDASEWNESTGAYDLDIASKTPICATLLLTYHREAFDWAWTTRYLKEHGNLSTAVVSDLSMAYRFSTQGTVRLAVQNIFDRDYELNEGYPMPGLNIRLGIEINF